MQPDVGTDNTVRVAAVVVICLLILALATAVIAFMGWVAVKGTKHAAEVVIPLFAIFGLIMFIDILRSLNPFGKETAWIYITGLLQRLYESIPSGETVQEQSATPGGSLAPWIKLPWARE